MKFGDTLKDAFASNLRTNTTPALFGEPGIGKSSFVEDLARSMNTVSFPVACNQLADKADLTGARLVPTDNGGYKQVFYPHHVVQDCIDYALENPRETPILFLDEINRTTSDVTSAALTLVTMRRLGHVDLPDNVRIVVAGNDKGNVTTLDEASLSRFAIYHVEPDAPTLIDILGDGLNEWVRKVLDKSPGLVFAKATPSAIAVDGSDDDDEDATATMADLFDAGEEMNQLTTPRTIDNVSRWLNDTGRDQLNRYLTTPTVVDGGRETTVLNELVEAHVGNTPFAIQLIAVIAEDLASGPGASAQPRVNVPMPSCYADLKAATTITELDERIGKLTEHEKSGALLAALHEKADNTRLVEHLAHAIHQPEKDHMHTLLQMLTLNQVEQQNLDAFANGGSALAQNLDGTLSVFV